MNFITQHLLIKWFTLYAFGREVRLGTWGLDTEHLRPLYQCLALPRVGAGAFFFRTPQPNVRTRRTGGSIAEGTVMWGARTRNGHKALRAALRCGYRSGSGALNLEIFCF